MKIETKTTHYVNYRDFDDAINSFLKSKGEMRCDFEIVAHHELGNDSCVNFTIGKYDWSKISEEKKQEILNGNLRYKGGKILEWMLEEKLIPAGEYIVTVSW